MHAEFILRVKREGQSDVVVGRRYGAFVELHRALRNELPGKVLPPVPRKIKASQSTTTGFLSAAGVISDDTASISSLGSYESTSTSTGSSRVQTPQPTHKKSASLGYSLGFGSSASRNPSRTSLDVPRPDQPIKLWRENQRISLRAFIRQLLEDKQVARSTAMQNFLLRDPIKLNEEERIDEDRRRAMDEIRLEEQRKFYEIARERARELDVYMESFRREIVESNGLTKLFAEIRKKNKLADLDIQYRKFAEWLRIEVAATIYHIFLAEDNSAELFAQGKKIHSLIPYTVLKNVIRIANPAAVMSGVLDLFLATPFKSRSLMQRVLSMAISDGIRHIQKSVDSLEAMIDDPVLCQKLKAFTAADENVKDLIREQAQQEGNDLALVILQSEDLGGPLEPKRFEKVFNAYVAYVSAVDNIHEEIKQSAQFFAHLKQLLKLYTRQRDKRMMQAMIEEPVTLQLFRDLFTIFYEPLIRVYKSANVYNSVTDFAVFVDDMIAVIEKAQSQDMSTDPNRTVQSFIDLCTRHEENFYKFVHEVHIHDDGLFDKLMGWLEDILVFLRHGPANHGKLDMNLLFEEAGKAGIIDAGKAKVEIDSLIDWQTRRRQWHQDKTRQKMASGDTAKSREAWSSTAPGGLDPKDFGIGADDLADLAEADQAEASDEDSEDDNTGDAIATERKKRKRHAEHLKARAGEPQKPVVEEIVKMGPRFLDALRNVLAD